MFYFSKSKYCLAKQCPKLLWLNKYRPDLIPEDPALQARFDEGNAVGDLAMGLFGDFTEVTAFKEDGKLDLNKMQAKTIECMENGVENICEASFSYNGLYCAVDILRKQNGGYAIYEVKSSTHTSPIYAADIAYQKYVLQKCGINVTGTYLIHIDSSYTRKDKLETDKLFKIVDLANEVAIEYPNVPSLLEMAEEVYAMGTAPETDIGTHCRDPYDCAFWDFCTNTLPQPNVFDLYRINFKKALGYYYDNTSDFESLYSCGEIKNKTQLRQIKHQLNNLPDEIDQKGIANFLSTLSYPIYFLDFETMQSVIPKFEGSRPYEQVPFQYSLHYIEYEGGPLLHKEFLAESGTDPRRAIAESLCKDIPTNVCVTAYNKSFECSRLRELAALYPDLADHLLNIADNIKDLLTPFQSGYYYNKAMGGTFSIKSVLPALFPNDPALNYHNLDQIHNGTEAMTIFPLIKDMPIDEQRTTRENLLKYCELDTLAMVKVWEKLKSAVE